MVNCHPLLATPVTFESQVKPQLRIGAFCIAESKSGACNKQDTKPYRLEVTSEIAWKPIIKNGPAATDDVDLLAKRYALWQCGLQDHLCNGGK